MNTRLTDDQESYLATHNLRPIFDDWLLRLAESSPDDPYEFLFAEVQKMRSGHSQILKCQNPWCEADVPMTEFEAHVRMCSPEIWNKCIRCNKRVDVTKMAQHRQNCRLVPCKRCGEFVFPRMLEFCPREFLAGSLESAAPDKKLETPLTDQDLLQIRREESSEMRPHPPPRENSLEDMRPEPSIRTMSPRDMKVIQVQAAWRSLNARRKFQQIVFRLVWHIIDIARESRFAKTGSEAVAVPQKCISFKGVIKPSSPPEGSFRRSIHGAADKTRRASCDPNALLEREVQLRHSPHDTEELIAQAEADAILDPVLILEIVQDATKLLSARPNVMTMTTPFEGATVIVGDIHGQLKDLMYILREEGMPKPTKIFCFNGDFVDRGTHSIEVLTIILSLLCTYPSSVFLNRGNHEDRKANSEYGFLVELQTKYEEFAEMYDAIGTLFKVMPLVHILDGKILIVHGGLPRDVIPVKRIDHIGHIREVPTVQQFDEDERIVVDLLWSDPVDFFKARTFGRRGKNWRPNPRGCGIEYNADHTEEFCEFNGLERIVRSHEMVPAGYREMHNAKSITVFSASDYCGVSGNRGAVCIFPYMSKEPRYKTWFVKDTATRRQASMLETPGDEEGNERAGMSEYIVSGVERKEVLRQLREAVFTNRYQLMSSFSALDTEESGEVTKVEWCEVMKNLTGFDIPWYYLCPFLADVVIHNEMPCVNYSHFLCAIDSFCGRKFRRDWIIEQVDTIFKTLDLPDDLIPPPPVSYRRTSRGNLCVAPENAPQVTKINFNQFCAALRAKSQSAAALGDNEIFVLFAFFDSDRDGHLELDSLQDVVGSLIEDEPELIESIDMTSPGHLAKRPNDYRGWMFSATMALQQMFLFGRNRGLEASFALLDRDGNGTLEPDEFQKVLRRLNKQSPHQLTESQLEQIFLIIDRDKSGCIDMQEFVDYFGVWDMRSEGFVKGLKQKIEEAPKQLVSSPDELRISPGERRTH